MGAVGLGRKLFLVIVAVAFFSSPAAAQSPEDLLRGILGGIVRESLRERPAEARRLGTQDDAERGLTKAQRTAIQNELNNRGFDVGKPDGSFGKGTRSGIARYQSGRGEQATGRLTRSQIADLTAGGGPAPVAASSGSFEILRGVDLDGNDLYRLDGIGLAQCSSACEADASCRAFTFNTAKDVCFLKSRAGRQVAFGSAISGRKGGGQPAPAAVASSGAFEMLQGVDLDGNDLRRIDGVGLDRCASACETDTSCGAFTFNTAKNVCFLKSRAGRTVSFAAAVSGRRTGQPAPTAVAGGQSAIETVPGKKFDLFGSTDMPGGDYRSGADDPALAGIPLGACRTACSADMRCKAFTYQEAEKICSLKEAAGRYHGATGVTTGVREMVPKPVIEDADVAWKEGEDEQAFIARIRSAAKPFGGECGSERQAIERLASTLAVSASTSAIKAGDPATVSWRRSEREKLPPAYLVVFTDAAARFSGKGFYTLMPGARAPFGIEAQRQKTRAIVPLAGPDAARSGEVRLHPLLAGEPNIGWQVVGYLRQCEEEVAGAAIETRVSVSIGEPRIAVADPFDLSRPKQTIMSPDGTRLIREFDDRFQLFDAPRMVLLGDYPGKQPRFSVTGRFVTFLPKERMYGFANEDANATNLIDSIDGTLTGNWISTPAAWGNHDSFVVGDAGAYGIVEVVNPLQSEQTISSGTITCFACAAWQGTRFRLDLENNVAVFATETNRDGDYLQIGGLTTDTVIARDMWNEKLQSKDDVLRTFASGHLMAGYREPSSWEIEGGLRISIPNLDPAYLADPSPDGYDRYAIEPILLNTQPVEAAALDVASGQTGSVEWRGAVPIVRPETASPTGYIQKLEDFGFRFGSSVSPEVLYDTAKPLYGSGLSDDDLRSFFWSRDKRLSQTIRHTTMTSNGTVFDNRCASPFTRDQNDQRLTFDAGDINSYGIWKNGDGEFAFIQIACSDGARAGASWTEFFVLDKTHRKGLRAAEFSGSRFDFYEGGMLVGWHEGGAQIANVSDFRSASSVEFSSRTSLTVDVRLTADRHHIVQIASDGSFFVFRIEDSALMLEGRYLDDEIVVWDDRMRFDATSEGAHYVSVAFPGNIGLYTLQQLAARHHVPGLVERTLDGESAGEIAAFGVPPRLTAELDTTDPSRIRGTARAETGSARQLRIFQDGMVTETLSFADGDEVSFDVPRLAGARWVSLVAADERNLLSLPVGRDLGAAGLPKVRSLAVGVDTYDAANLKDLSYAAADAATFTGSLDAANGTSIALETPVRLTDGEATPEAVIAAAERLVAEAKAGETIAVFFAGHGLTGPDGRYYMATSATDLDRIAETSLSWDALSAVLSRSKARVVVFLDACHSGAAGAVATNDDAAGDMLAGIPSGLVVLAASKGRQFSEENPAAGGGVFTNAVADVIARRRAVHDANGNGAIEVSELYGGVKRLVMERTEGRQTPWLARNQMVGDFALF